MKKIVLLLFIVFFYLFPQYSVAQNRTIDSLQALIKTDDADTNKVNHLNTLCLEYKKTGGYDTGLKFGNDALHIAKQLNFEKGIANSYCNIGGIYLDQGIYNNALENYLTSLKIREEIQDKKGIGDAFNNIGAIYVAQGNYANALENYFASLKIREAIGDKKEIAISFNNIGVIYYNQGNYSKALENYSSSLKLRKEIGNNEDIAGSYNNIGVVYETEGDLDKALENYFLSLVIRQKLGNKRDIADSYNNIGNVYTNQAKTQQSVQHKQGLYNKAMENYLASLKIKEEIGDKSGIATTYYNIGEVYLDEGKTAEATKQLLASLKIYKEIGAKDDIKDAYQMLSYCDSAAGNWKGAYHYHQLFKNFNDSVFNEESTKKTAEMNAKYESGKKEAQITQMKLEAAAESKRQSIILLAVTSGLAVVLVFSFIVFRQRNKIAKGKKRSDELLLNILPEEVAEELKETGGAKAKSFEKVSVLFTDFVGFTSISEKLTPTELVEEIHLCFTAFDGIMERNGMEKIKTIGDAYLAVCGLPNEDPLHAQKAVQSALEIIDFINQREIEGGHFKIRVGINSGPVIAGIVGVKKFAYDIWGDTVNTAARMEQNSKNGKINISGSTYELVKDDFICLHRGKIEAKNKGEIDMYYVESKKS